MLNTYTRLRGKIAITYKKSDQPRKKPPLSKTGLNLMQNSAKGYQLNGEISSATRKKISVMLECYLNSIHAKRVENWTLRKANTKVPTFITLTYPSAQVHCDKYLKREHLTPFLQYLTRTKKVSAYFWKAELQANGNQHFHIMSDTFIAWSEVRGMWNHIVESDGYVTRFEERHGHRNPNSTDIEAIRDYQKGIAYISKYITKGEKHTSVGRTIAGRVWGCSDNLRALTPFTLSAYDQDSFWYDVRNYEDVTGELESVKLSDFVSVTRLENNTAEFLKKVSPDTLKIWSEHWRKQAALLSL